jgi:hypothetical protein
MRAGGKVRGTPPHIGRAPLSTIIGTHLSVGRDQCPPGGVGAGVRSLVMSLESGVGLVHYGAERNVLSLAALMTEDLSPASCVGWVW